jgi:ubiquinone biosynthesis protein
VAVAEQISGILTARSRARYREVLAILMRYGLSEIIENLAHGRVSPRISAKAVREALCELGPAFIKFGQLLSTRDELLSKPFRDELAKLQDEATPFPFTAARALIEEELGAELGKLFDRIDESPIASGSIGQVHRARLHDGTEVVVKVQRKGLEAILECDTSIIQQLILRFGNTADKGDSAARLVSDFLNDVQSELDYELEANNLDRFAWQFEHDPGICIPRVIRSHSARHVLTTTYEPGTKLADIPLHTTLGKRAAQDFAKTLLRQIFCFGFFHGDPHADNVVVARNGSIGFYDLGLVGELCISERESMNSLLYALLQQNPDMTTASLIALAGSPEAFDTRSLRNDLEQFIATHRHTYTSSVPVTRLLADILQITAKHRLVLPRGFYLAFKSLATTDSVGKTLDPDFDLIKIALPLLRQNQPAALPPIGNDSHTLVTGAEALWHFQDLSAALRTTFTQLSQGELKLQCEHRGLDDAVRSYDQTKSRLAWIQYIALLTLGGYGIICCAMIAKLMTLQQAVLWGCALALVSGAVVLLIHRMMAYKTRHTR